MDSRVQYKFRSRSQYKFQNNKPKYNYSRLSKFPNSNDGERDGFTQINDLHESISPDENENRDMLNFDGETGVYRNEFKRILKNVYCTNCGKPGHEYKQCTDAIISIGIILLKFDYCKIRKFFSDLITCSDDKIDIINNGIKIESSTDISLFSKLRENIKFLIIRRKHTLGYIEFIRGRYKPDNVDGIVFLFQQMTKEEIAKIGTMSITELWDDFWVDTQKKLLYEKEFQKTKQKFEKLKNGDETELTLDFYVKHVVPTWDQAEWGFPKGRRNKSESNKECALREFEEETGLIKDDYILLEGIKPLVEEFIGTNGVRYKHIYYVGYANSDTVPYVDVNQIHQVTEIGDIGYYTYNEVMDMIRPYHVERKRIIMKLYMYLLEKIIRELKLSIINSTDIENEVDVCQNPDNQNGVSDVIVNVNDMNKSQKTPELNTCIDLKNNECNQKTVKKVIIKNKNNKNVKNKNKNNKINKNTKKVDKLSKNQI